MTLEIFVIVVYFAYGICAIPLFSDCLKMLLENLITAQSFKNRWKLRLILTSEKNRKFDIIWSNYVIFLFGDNYFVTMYRFVSFLVVTYVQVFCRPILELFNFKKRKKENKFDSILSTCAWVFRRPLYAIKSKINSIPRHNRCNSAFCLLDNLTMGLFLIETGCVRCENSQ